MVLDDEADGTGGAGEGASTIVVSASYLGDDGCADLVCAGFVVFSLLLGLGVGSGVTTGAGAGAGEAGFIH